jgi:hypothetical protein
VKFNAANPGAYAISGVDSDLRLSDVILQATPGVYLVTGDSAKAILEVDQFPVGSGGAFVVIIND